MRKCLKTPLFFHLYFLQGIKITNKFYSFYFHKLSLINFEIHIHFINYQAHCNQKHFNYFSFIILFWQDFSILIFKIIPYSLQELLKKLKFFFILVNFPKFYLIHHYIRNQLFYPLHQKPILLMFLMIL